MLALAEHDDLPERERRRLDREIGARLPGAEGLELLRAWLAEAPGPALAARIRRLAPAFRALDALVGSAGLFLGWAAASTLLSFEVHEGRINIVTSVAVLVLLPALAWIFSLLGWGVARLRRAPGSQGLTPGDWLRGGALGALALRLLPQSIRQDLEVVMGRVAAHGRLYLEVQRGQLLLWAQILGLGFATGALAATWAFVVFTDLAFGWSTTLEIGAEPVHALVHALATPWAWLWPAASPGLELVEATRFFRVAPEDHIHVVDPILYGGWWPFLVMAIAFYAWLPRLLTAGAVALWLARATARAMDFTPGVDRLLDRLTTPLVDSRATVAEPRTGGLEGTWAPVVDLAEWWRARAEEAGTSWLVRWAGVSTAGLPRASQGQDPDQGPGWPGVERREAGGRRSLEQDAALVREVGEGEGAVVVAVRGYEPPLLDFLDLLFELRAGMGRDRGVAVLLRGGDEDDLAAWRRRLATLGDPRLVVAQDVPPEEIPREGFPEGEELAVARVAPAAHETDERESGG